MKLKYRYVCLDCGYSTESHKNFIEHVVEHYQLMDTPELSLEFPGVSLSPVPQ